MRSLTWGILFVLSLVWSTVATGKELSPREIYEQASPAVVMVMGYADGGRKGSGEPVRSFSRTDWFSPMPTL